MIENIFISCYIAIIALYFRHSAYHVIAVCAISAFVLIDFNDEFAIYSIIPALIVTSLYLMSNEKVRRCGCKTNAVRPQLLRPFVFLIISYHVFDMNADIPLGAIRTAILSDFVYVGFVWFDAEFSCHFTHIRHIYMAYTLIVIIAQRLYFTATAFFSYYCLTHFMPGGFLALTKIISLYN